MSAEKCEVEPYGQLKQAKKNPNIKQIIAKNGYIYSLHSDNCVRIWTIEEGKCVNEVQVDGKVSIEELRIGFLYLTAGNSVVTWDTQAKKFLKNQTFKGHTDWITRFYLSGGVLYTASNDRTVRAWNTKTGHCLSVYQGHEESVSCLDVYGTMLVTGSSDKTLRIWKAIKAEDLLSEETSSSKPGKEKQRTPEQILVGHTRLVFNVKLMGNTSAFSASLDGTIRSWNLRTGKCLQTYDIEPVVNNFRVDFRITDEDENVFLLSSEKFTIHMWSLKTAKYGETFVGHRAEIKALKYKRGYLFSGSADREIRQWSLKDGKCVLVMKGHADPVTSIAITGDRLFSGCEDGVIRVWKVNLKGSSSVTSQSTYDDEIQKLKEMGINQQFTDDNLPPSPSRFSSAAQKRFSEERKGSSTSLTKLFGKGDKEKKQTSEERLPGLTSPNVMEANGRVSRSPSLSVENTSNNNNNNANSKEEEEEEMLLGWYVGPMPREKAEAHLLQCSQNCFLVRTSSIAGCYALTKFMAANRTFQHLLIIQANNRYMFKDSFDVNTYSSLGELVSKSPECAGFAPAFEDDEDAQSPSVPQRALFTSFPPALFQNNQQR